MPDQSLFQVLKSVLAAFIGVQSDKNRQTDFAQGSMATYIIVGILFTALFVGVVIFVVSKALGN